jgi:hypothetical protein
MSAQPPHEAIWLLALVGGALLWVVIITAVVWLT